MPPLAAAGIADVAGEEKVVKAVGEEDCAGWADRWMESGKEDSKNCWRSSSARITIRKVGRVMWRGFAGSRARLAECFEEGLVMGCFREEFRCGSGVGRVSSEGVCIGEVLLGPRSRRSSSESESPTVKLSVLASSWALASVVPLVWFWG